jgi:predicted ATPase/class 3 adenylate cyclase
MTRVVRRRALTGQGVRPQAPTVVRRRLPTGTVTLVFTDIEGSTRLLKELGNRYGEVLGEHRRILREAFQSHGGVEVDTQGDAFFYAFSKATDALTAAQEGQAALAPGEVRVRIGIHTGEPFLTDQGYIGVDVHRAARICSAAHGGQTVLSDATARLVEAELRDLGEQRLKDIDAPQRLYQLGHQDFPPLRTLNFSNLPVPATELVGRERESEAVRELLNEHRLITLVGPGGSGKTRLALQVAAAAIDDFKDGIYWVPLAPVREPDLVEPTIAQAVGVTDGLAHHLGNRQILLLLDNFEQVIDAAPRLGELLGATSALKLLVTSREPLQLSGEWDYALPPLPQTDAVVLFTERARALKADFEPDDAAAEICRLLDGLPLALELAAARVRVLSTPQMLDRLGRRLDLLTASARDVPTRQRTLRATVDWSYDLLAPEEQELFVRLAVFSGGWTLDAAEAVCDANLDTLQSLVAKSLVARQGERFGMLETLREYALERLEASAECESLRGRHARLFLALAEEGATEFERGEQEIWTQRLNLEHNNLRASLDRFIQSGETDLELRLVAAMWHFWFDQGLWRESSRAVERALATSAGTTPARVAVMLGAAWTVWRQGDTRAGTVLAEECLQQSRALGDERLIAHSLRILGACVMSGDPARSSALMEEAAGLSESVGDQAGLAAVVNNLAIIAMDSGDNRKAIDGFKRAISITEQTGNKRGTSISLMNLAHAEVESGMLQEARTHFAEGLAAARRFGIREVIVESLYGMASLAVSEGEYWWAGAFVGLAQREGDFGHSLEDRDKAFYERTISSIRQALGADDIERAIAAGRGMSLETAVEFLRSGSDVGRPLA